MTDISEKIRDDVWAEMYHEILQPFSDKISHISNTPDITKINNAIDIFNLEIVLGFILDKYSFD